MASASLTSGLLAAGTTTVVNRKSLLNGFIALSDGTNTSTVTLFDNASAGSGTVLGKAIANTGQSVVTITFDNPVKADLGITVVVSGTGSGAVIYFDAA